MPSGDGAKLIALEGRAVTLPSAVFWDADGLPPQFGRAAIAAYTGGEDGRLMRGLKSALGSSLIHEKTRVGNKALAFTDILGRFFGHLKTKLDETMPGVSHAVLGSIARANGFADVGFQYEPIAAALHYESSVTREELVLIVDIGGGTSDFSLVRVSPGNRTKLNRDNDILGTHGIRVGGTDCSASTR